MSCIPFHPASSWSGKHITFASWTLESFEPLISSLLGKFEFTQNQQMKSQLTLIKVLLEKILGEVGHLYFLLA